MFISDHETEVDLLYYDSIAQTIVHLIQESNNLPITIGVHGDWGAGKSSILLMIERLFDEKDDVLVLHFNGWQFQGFEDAKAAIIEATITSLRDERGTISKVREKATSLLKRVNYLKLAKKIGPHLFTLATGIPHPQQITDAYAVLRGLLETNTGSLGSDDLASAIGLLDGILKPGEQKKVPEEVMKFAEEFEDLIKQAELSKLVETSEK